MNSLHQGCTLGNPKDWHSETCCNLQYVGMGNMYVHNLCVIQNMGLTNDLRITLPVYFSNRIQLVFRVCGK
jgi:hypothetical protein